MRGSPNGIHPFFSGSGPHGNVRFNFLRRDPYSLPALDLSAYAAGYHRAGRSLVDSLAARNGFADYEGYPILFLYRHALELNMKAFIYRGAMCAGLMDGCSMGAEWIYRSHDLLRLLPALREVFAHVGGSGDFGLPGLNTWEDFCGLVRGIDSLDHGSYAFRYPMDTAGEPSHPHHLVVNVIAFGRNMDPVLDMLNAAVCGLEELWQNAAEACHFLQEVAKEWSEEQRRLTEDR